MMFDDCAHTLLTYLISPYPGELVVGNPKEDPDITQYSIPPGRYCLLYPQHEFLEAFVCFSDSNVTEVSRERNSFT